MGCNREDWESRKIFCSGIVVREPITPPSNFRSSESFNSWLVNHGVVGLSGVDTRALTQNVREKGPRMALIYFAKLGEVVTVQELFDEIRDEPVDVGMALAAEVSMEESYIWEEGTYRLAPSHHPPHHPKSHLNGHGDAESKKKYHVVVIDYGVKKNILRCLVETGFKVTVVPALHPC